MNTLSDIMMAFNRSWSWLLIVSLLTLPLQGAWAAAPADESCCHNQAMDRHAANAHHDHDDEKCHDDTGPCQNDHADCNGACGVHAVVGFNLILPSLPGLFRLPGLESLVASPATDLSSITPLLELRPPRRA